MLWIFTASLRGEHISLNKPMDFEANLIRSLVCEFQGLYPQNSFLVAEAHKRLKQAVREEEDPERIREHCQVVAFQLKNGVKSSIEIARKHHEQYYSERADNQSPRFCVKVFEEGHIKELGAPESSHHNLCKVEDNTAFEHIRSTGTYFLSNDLFSAASKISNQQVIENTMLCQF